MEIENVQVHSIQYISSGNFFKIFYTLLQYKNQISFKKILALLLTYY